MRRENSPEMPNPSSGRMPRRNAIVFHTPRRSPDEDRPPVTPQRQLSQYRGVPRNTGLYNGLHRLLFDLRER